MVLDTDNIILIVYIIALVELTIILIYFFYKTKIPLIIRVKIFGKYFDFCNVFLLGSTIELLVYIGINNHSINLFDNKQLFYSLIYSLESMQLKTFNI